jgi:acetylornithine deacetylase/succinyl-diaminopimelate desuccinylase-like protein
MEDVVGYLDAHRERFVAELVKWVAIPSISASPEHRAEVARSAEYLRAELAALGADDVRILETPGHPAVFASFGAGPDKPTLLVYGHHDVQPVEPLGEWRSPPFEATVKDGRLYGRGTVDDKGQVFLHMKAIEAFLRGGRGALPIHVKLLVEGEEEVGSPNLAGLLREHAELLASDYVCVSDTAMFGRGLPSLCVGLRGVVYLELIVRGASTDVHSGSFGGGIANPANVLARIVASLHDEGGKITVPGFYDRVRELSAREREEIARLPHDDAAWLAMSGARACVGEAGYSTLERIWARPTLDVTGLSSGHIEGGAKTIIPAAAIAHVSCRIVPDQDPLEIEALVEAHIRRLAPPSVSVEIRIENHGARPYLADVDHPIFDVARRAFARAFGKDTVLMREGGTIPFVRTIADATGKPTLLMGFGQPDENSHAPNEWLDLENFHLGAKSAAWLYEEIGLLSNANPRNG